MIAKACAMIQRDNNFFVVVRAKVNKMLRGSRADDINCGWWMYLQGEMIFLQAAVTEPTTT